jgi:IS1 family transposase
MANVLPTHKQVAVIRALTEGCSVRSVERIVGVSRETVLSLLVRVGEGCDDLLNDTMRDLDADRFEVDEIWSYVGKKQRHVTAEDTNEVGDTWTYVAIEAETKLIPTFLVGKRTQENTNAFIADLASRTKNRVQISTDGLEQYKQAIARAFGDNVDYGQIVKSYEADPIGPGRYSPPKVSEITKKSVYGEPDEEFISTSYAERQNLTMRMQIRRMTRLTNAFSKKLQNHKAATALHFANYNFVRRHGTLRTSPAMAAGICDTLWDTEQLVEAALHGVRP